MPPLLPSNDSKLALMLSNFSHQIDAVGVTLGLTPAFTKSMQRLCGNVIAALSAKDQKRKDWQAAAKAVSESKAKDLVALRKMIAHMKTNPAWNGTHAKTLGVAKSPAPDKTSPTALQDHKPALRVSKQAGRIELRFTRGKLDGVNVFGRKKGEPDWRLLGRIRHSPFVDETPPSVPGAPEVREYRIQAVYKDLEIGKPSDIISVTVVD